MGLFEHAFSNRTLLSQVGTHRQLAREAVRQSVVLLKNGMTTERNGTNGTNGTDGTAGSKRILPLRKDEIKILVAGKSADDIGRQCGGWTLTWQGASGNTVPGKQARYECSLLCRCFLHKFNKQLSDVEPSTLRETLYADVASSHPSSRHNRSILTFKRLI